MLSVKWSLVVGGVERTVYEHGFLGRRNDILTARRRDSRQGLALVSCSRLDGRWSDTSVIDLAGERSIVQDRKGESRTTGLEGAAGTEHPDRD